MPAKLDGPILNPPDVMYLMNYNFNVDTCKNKHKKKTGNVNKLYDFDRSIYQPDPSHENQYNRYKREIQLAYIHIAKDWGNKTPYICLTDRIIHSHYHIMDDTDRIASYARLGDQYKDVYKIVEGIIIDIDNTPPAQAVAVSSLESIRESINRQFKFLDDGDETEMRSIAVDAFIYVSDDKYDQQIMRREKLIALYDRGLAKPDSMFSHNLIRNAVESGRIWLVKFLVDKGVSTKNLPCYGKYGHELESKQLIDIVNEKYKNYSGFGSEYVEQQQILRDSMRRYLTENNLI